MCRRVWNGWKIRDLQETRDWLLLQIDKTRKNIITAIRLEAWGNKDARWRKAWRQKTNLLPANVRGGPFKIIMANATSYRILSRDQWPNLQWWWVSTSGATLTEELSCSVSRRYSPAEPIETPTHWIVTDYFLPSGIFFSFCTFRLHFAFLQPTFFYCA